MKIKILTVLVFLWAATFIHAESPLAPQKTDNPRDTMRTYMEAMNDYKKGLQNEDDHLQERINDAVRCLNLEHIAILNRGTVGREAAILLKEVIDRVIVIDYSKIPEASENPEEPLLRWRLKDTEITIAKVKEGDRAGEFLFTSDTVSRAQEFYKKVKHLPYLEGTTKGAGYKEPWIKRNVPSWTMKQFWGLAYWQWIGLGIAVVIIAFMRLAVSAVLQVVDRILHKLPTEWAKRVIDTLASPIALLADAGIGYASIHVLQLDGVLFSILDGALQVTLFVAVTWIFYKAVDLMMPHLRSFAQRKDNHLDEQIVLLITRTLKVLVIVLGVLLALQNFGVKIFSLLAGLGIGGLALALAAQDTLANFFGSIMIMFDRPFQIGHYISLNGIDGVVEDIGFRSTKIRTFQHSVVAIPNSEVAKANIDNMEMRQYRRVRTTLGVVYSTPPEKLEEFIKGIRDILENHSYTRKGPGMINVSFYEFADSSLNIFMNFYIKAPNWAFELAERQHIFLEIMRLAKSIDVDFAFPSRTIYLENSNPEIANRN